jgi:hypothetical protein
VLAKCSPSSSSLRGRGNRNARIRRDLRGTEQGPWGVHPEDMKITAPAATSAPWMGAFSPTLTAWSGPWGVSFSANLTPRRVAGFQRAAIHSDDAPGPASGPGAADSAADALASLRENDRRGSEGGLRLSSANHADQKQGAGSDPVGQVIACAAAVDGNGGVAQPRARAGNAAVTMTTRRCDLKADEALDCAAAGVPQQPFSCSSLAGT